VEAEDAERQRDLVVKKGQAVNTFDNFGRDAERFYMDCVARRSKPNYIAAEYQDCFGHSLVEVLRSPSSDAEISALTAGLRTMCENLKERGIISAFAFAPNDDVELSTAFIAAGFRKTGLLAQGIVIGKERKDAILWTQKLANPADEE
jgi:hypothetical protein